MASVILNGDTSGTVTLSAPAVAGSSTQTLAAVSGTLAPIVSGTAVTASGTSIDFTGIPSWVKKITVMISGISYVSTVTPIVQIGSGTVTTSGYLGGSWVGAGTTTNYSSGFIISQAGTLASDVLHAVGTLYNMGSNRWMWGVTGGYQTTYIAVGGGSVTIGGTLDIVRITSATAAAFDAGTINIMYE